MKAPRFGAVMKVIRRIHMYLGLLMYPWVLLYGLSGMLFNHPQLGRDLSRRTLAPGELEAHTHFEPWNMDRLAGDVVGALNRKGPVAYRLVGAPKMMGWPIMVSPRPDGGRDVMILNLTTGRGGVVHHPPAPSSPEPPFAGTVDTPRYTMATVEKQLEPLAGALGLQGPPLRVHPKVAPEVWLELDDGQQRWHAVYDLRTGTLSGRPAAGPSALPFVELLGQLHTQHHFPVQWGASGYWAVLADLTGLSLILWALTGLAMWWQMKPTRRWGALTIAASMVLAAAVMTGMVQELLFVPKLGGGP